MSKPLYSAYVLCDSSREKLLKRYPPKYKKVIAHHVTVQFGNLSFDDVPMEARIDVVGYIDSGDGIEALVVSVDGSTRRSDGSLYHITWSLENKYRPVDSNRLLSVKNYSRINSITIETTPTVVGT